MNYDLKLFYINTFKLFVYTTKYLKFILLIHYNQTINYIHLYNSYYTNSYLFFTITFALSLI